MTAIDDFFDDAHACLVHIQELLNKLGSINITLRECNTIIHARYAAGESQANHVREFGISYQRVYQIVHNRRK